MKPMTHLLQIALFMALCLLTGQNVFADPVQQLFEVEVSRGFSGLIELKDGRLFAVDQPLNGWISSDEGHTWEKTGPLLDSRGERIPRGSGYLVSMVRLASGAIGVKGELRQPGTTREQYMLNAFFIKSTDEGKTWSDPVPITYPGVPSNTTWMIRTQAGRLVLPNEYWFAQPGEERGIGICHAFYSDDEGESWNQSLDYMMVWEKDGLGQGACEVPSVVETADGRLLMFMRTWYQRMAQSYSTDGGKSWSPVELNDLVSSNAELFLTKIPTTGDLLCIWNQASTHEIKKGFYRARLTSAISKDNGKTWEHFRTIAQSPGQSKARRITQTAPAGFLQTPTAVPKP